MKEGLHLHVSGVVQGVGFRPFVFGLAARYGLSGWVCNTGDGVEMDLSGERLGLQQFCTALQQEAPPLARIEGLTKHRCAPKGYERFEIRPSQTVFNGGTPAVPADVALCPDCRRELFDPADRRYRYPFINCTHCGPRYTVISSMPYDRPATTMAGFALCPACAAEYHDATDRRFHAQPVACPACGPQLWLEQSGAVAARREEALQEARDLLAQGAIVALKGLGGFQLACDASHAAAVARLRQLKQRPQQALALMMPDLEAVRRHCRPSADDEALLLSRERPIVLLPARDESRLLATCAPGQKRLGVMLPSTPLHELLLERAAAFPEALVMTSGNRSGEPIIIDNDEARDTLGAVADALLLHDRPIAARCDDSVALAAQDGATQTAPALYPLRRARGYAPLAVALPLAAPVLLAAGAELKNTFCLARGRQAFMSPHVGDLQNLSTLQAFEQAVAHMEKLFAARPALLAHDLHPDYLSTRYALARAERDDLPAVGVQHHHAHIAAVMAEHGLPADRLVLGLAFDGAGYGADGTVWGGECMVASYHSFERLFHLKPAPLPGGDLAVRQPWRMALSWLAQVGLPWRDDLAPVRHARAHAVQGIDPLPVLRQQLASGLNSPTTSSMGRLFDAVAALLGVQQVIGYEGQAAIELEALVDESCDEAYAFCVDGSLLCPGPALQAILHDLSCGAPRPLIAARFHNGVARLAVDVCRRMRRETGLNSVALSGGVWQNKTLLQKAWSMLLAEHFDVYCHRRVPANDGGLALGQAVVAAAQFSGESICV